MSARLPAPPSPAPPHRGRPAAPGTPARLRAGLVGVRLRARGRRQLDRRRRGARQRLGARHRPPADPARGTAAGRPAGRRRRQPVGGTVRRRRHAPAGQAGSPRPAPGAGGRVVAGGHHEAAGPARPRAVLRRRCGRRQAPDLPGQGDGVTIDEPGEERSGQHRPLARRDVDRRVRRLAPRPGVEPPWPGVRPREPPLVREGRPERGQRGRRRRTAQRDHGPRRHDPVPHRGARRARGPVRLPPQRAHRHPARLRASATASLPRG